MILPELKNNTKEYVLRLNSVCIKMADYENMYTGKSKTNSNIAWHRPQSTSCRVEDELIEKSSRALNTTTDPLERLRLMCLSRGASGIMELGRRVPTGLGESMLSHVRKELKQKFFRKMDDNGSNQLNKEEFFTCIKETGLKISHEDAEKLFAQFDTHSSGSISVDEFIEQIRPPMNDGRRAIVERAFKKLDKTEAGVIATEDLRGVYSVDSNPRYKSGEEYEELIVNKFLANFESEGTVDGKITREEFLNYYSGISVSIDNDCYFDLMMRQAYKL